MTPRNCADWNGLRQEFVANVSHELKTPLTGIKLCTETLLAGAVEDPEHRIRFLEQIAAQGERLHLLILDLLSLARVESGEELFEFEAVSVPSVVRACLERHRPKAEARRQTLDLASESQPAPRRLGRSGSGRTDPRQPARQRPEIYAGRRPHPRGLGRGKRPRLGPGRRRRHRHSRSRSAAHLRALLSGGQGALAADGRHRPRTGHRQAFDSGHEGKRAGRQPSSAAARRLPSACRERRRHDSPFSNLRSIFIKTTHLLHKLSSASCRRIKASRS